MKKLFIIMIMVGVLTAWLNVEAWSAQKYSGWTYLGTEGCDDSKYPVYKKDGTENEFFLQYSDGNRVYFKMESSGYFKMSDYGKIWECERGGRNDMRDRFYCHRIIEGVDRFQKCNDENNFTDDFLFNSTKKMCKRNWGMTFDFCRQKTVEFAYDNRTYSPPNWAEEDSKSEQAEAKELHSIQQDIADKEAKMQTWEEYNKSKSIVTQQQIETSTDSKMKILKHRSGGCDLIITNHTVYEFQIKINGVDYGMIPTRKAAKIQDLNCDGFMVEAWPQGTVTGFVSRAFQHNQKQGKTFNWNLRYKK